MRRGDRESTVIQKRRLLEAYRGTLCVPAKAARAVGISRDTYYRWLKEDDGFRIAIEEAEMWVNDMVDDVLKSLIAARHWPSVHFYLKHRHPDYGGRIRL